MQFNKERITSELCKSKTLLFFPRNRKEAIFIQIKLFELGVKWVTGSEDIRYLKDCLDTGMHVSDGKLYIRPGTVALKEGLICTPDQLNDNYLSATTLHEIHEQFNRLAERVEAIAAKVDAIYDDLHHKGIDKPKLPSRFSPGKT